jgi:hypothetical protein
MNTGSECRLLFYFTLNINKSELNFLEPVVAFPDLSVLFLSLVVGKNVYEWHVLNPFFPIPGPATSTVQAQIENASEK